MAKKYQLLFTHANVGKETLTKRSTGTAERWHGWNDIHRLNVLCYIAGASLYSAPLQPHPHSSIVYPPQLNPEFSTESFFTFLSPYFSLLCSFPTRKTFIFFWDTIVVSQPLLLKVRADLSEPRLLGALLGGIRHARNLWLKPYIVYTRSGTHVNIVYTDIDAQWYKPTERRSRPKFINSERDF